MYNPNALEQTVAEKSAYINEVAQRSKRNNFIEQIEQEIVDSAPLPCWYDVNTTQPINFREYTFTEYLTGVYVRTQNIEINCRILDSAARTFCEEDHISKVLESFEDKYELKSMGSDYWPERVAFLAGSNYNVLMDQSLIAREMFEFPDMVLKPHPLTSSEDERNYRLDYGKTRVISKDISGYNLLLNCKMAYVTSATELGSMAALLDKDIVNISEFHIEGQVTYYPIMRILFRTPKEKRKEILNNIIGAKFSGLIFPWMEDREERLAATYEKSLEFRQLLSPISQPTRFLQYTSEVK
jgi:hypothetical protein